MAYIAGHDLRRFFKKSFNLDNANRFVFPNQPQQRNFGNVIHDGSPQQKRRIKQNTLCAFLYSFASLR
jgi:hypothetical protein